jgi:hypothetical protein
MLSQDDRRQLEMIAKQLQSEDPDFARALREGRPRSTFQGRQWPLVVGAVLSGLVFMIGVLAAAIGVMLFGGAAFAYTLGALWVRARRAHGPKVRPSRRRRRP